MADITRFAIRGLYDERDIEIPLESNVKILVAENGYGKTTVLNSLYGLISGDLVKLRKIPFKSLEIDFSDGDKIVLEKKDLDFTIENTNNHFYTHLKSVVGESKIYDLFEEFINTKGSGFRKSPVYNYVRRKMDIPEHILNKYLRELTDGDNNCLGLSRSKEILETIKLKTNYNFLYLPTYRRVEQDLRDLGIDNDDNSFIYDNSINFGMRDVDKKIKEITKEILTSSVEWFSKVNGQMLSQLVDGFTVDEFVKSDIINADTIKIVLDRIGTNIDESYKSKIIHLIESKEIFTGHDPLIYFIANLSKVYEQQKDNDLCIQEFTDVCNRYLGDKKIEYNESNVTVRIIRRKNGKEVGIENLSSGEKQIISLFSKLYIQKENLAIFLDEPELSLSMEWQKTLLPDIMKSGKCDFLFTTTHSPFIFENELSSKTVDLGKYITEL